MENAQSFQKRLLANHSSEERARLAWALAFDMDADELALADKATDPGSLIDWACAGQRQFGYAPEAKECRRLARLRRLAGDDMQAGRVGGLFSWGKAGLKPSYGTRAKALLAALKDNPTLLWGWRGSARRRAVPLAFVSTAALCFLLAPQFPKTGEASSFLELFAKTAPLALSGILLWGLFVNWVTTMAIFMFSGCGLHARQAHLCLAYGGRGSFEAEAEARAGAEAGIDPAQFKARLASEDPSGGGSAIFSALASYSVQSEKRPQFEDPFLNACAERILEMGACAPASEQALTARLMARELDKALPEQAVAPGAKGPSRL